MPPHENTEPVIMDRGESMTSFSIKKPMIKTADGEVHETTEWVQMVVKLESTAPGDNYVGYSSGSEMLHIEPGDKLGPVWVAPGTTIYVATTSAAVPANFSFLFTELPFRQILEALVTSSEVVATVGAPYVAPRQAVVVSKKGRGRVKQTRRRVLYRER